MQNKYTAHVIQQSKSIEVFPISQHIDVLTMATGHYFGANDRVGTLCMMQDHQRCHQFHNFHVCVLLASSHLTILNEAAVLLLLLPSPNLFHNKGK